MMTGLMGVITFGVIAGIGLLAYLAVEYTERKGKEKQREATEYDWKKILAEYLGKSCEVTIKEPMVNIDVIYSTRGILRDMDDEWLELECKEKKGTVVRIIRLDQVKGAKEIR